MRPLQFRHRLLWSRSTSNSTSLLLGSLDVRLNSFQIPSRRSLRKRDRWIPCQMWSKGIQSIDSSSRSNLSRVLVSFLKHSRSSSKRIWLLPKCCRWIWKLWLLSIQSWRWVNTARHLLLLFSLIPVLFISPSSTDDFLTGVEMKASNKQRNIGILFAYIAFNIFLALVGFYLYSVRSHKQVTPKKKSDSYSSNNEVGSENEKEQPLSKTGSSEAEAETGGVTPAADPSTRPSTSASPQ